MLGKMALFGGICATIVQRNRERILTEEGHKGTDRNFGRQAESRLILVVCGIAVKERRIHDFKGLTRGGRPLSR